MAHLPVAPGLSIPVLLRTIPPAAVFAPHQVAISGHCKGEKAEPSSAPRPFFRYWLKGPTIFPEGDQVAVLGDVTDNQIQQHPEPSRHVTRFDIKQRFIIRNSSTTKIPLPLSGRSEKPAFSRTIMLGLKSCWRLKSANAPRSDYGSTSEARFGSLSAASLSAEPTNASRSSF
jgi:hypothetical protein